VRDNEKDVLPEPADMFNTIFLLEDRFSIISYVLIIDVLDSLITIGH